MNKLISASVYCESIFDGTHESPKPVEQGKLLITSKHISGGNLNYSKAYLISDKDYISIQKRSRVSQWDILFSMIGTVGEVYLEKNAEIPYAIKNLGVFSCKDESRAKWLYYYLKSPAAKSHIARFLNGAVQKFLPLGALREFPVIPYDEQKLNLLKVLEAIDSKIALNNQINCELESIARTLYDYWFLQFNFPDSRGNEYSNNNGLFAWDPIFKKDIPREWKVCKLKDFEPSIITGKTPPTNEHLNYGGDIPFITIGDIRNGMHITKTEILLSEQGANLQRNKFIPKGAICVSCIASPGLVGISTKPSQTNQQINSIICSKEYSRNYLYFVLKDHFQYSFGAKAGNTFANMNKNDFSAINIIVPDEHTLLSFMEISNPIFDKILNVTNQNDTLTSLRDWLLPMLMHGQISINPNS
jgi:type I restriction enzyme S subunit